MKVLLGLITAVFIFSSLAGAAEVKLTLDEAVSFALRDNREILLKEEEINLAKAELAKAQAQLFPSLSFTGGWSQTRGYSAKDYSQNTTQLTLKQYLYKGGEIINTIRKDKEEIIVSQAVLDKERLQLTLQVRKAFYTLLLAFQLAEINKGIVVNSQLHLLSIKQRYGKGEASQSDILQAKAGLDNVRQQYTLSLNQVAAGQALLSNLLYLDKDIQIRPKGSFAFQPQELAYDEAFLEAMKNRPEIRQYEAQARADKSAVEAAKAGSRPDIYFSWDYYSRSHIAGTTIRNPNDYNILGFTFSWPIFDGWESRAKVEQAMVQLRQTQLLQEKTVKDIAQEVKDAYLALKDAIAKIKAVASEIKVYADNLKVTRRRYQKGMSSLLDSSDAALKYAVSRFKRSQAIYDYLIAKFSFGQATGGM